MALKIVKYPHPALRRPAVPITLLDKEIRKLAGELAETMYAHHGLGLAAPQVAMPYQMFVMRHDPEKEDEHEVVLNPVIVESSTLTAEAEEGCLSFPKLYQKVRRPVSVKVQGITLEGKPFEKALADLPARCFQHEYDHLHGRLYIDYFGLIAKLASRQELAAFEKEHRREQEKKALPSDKELLRQLEALAERQAG